MKVRVGMIVWRQITVETHMSVVNLCRRPGVEYKVVTNDALVERARGTIATDFLENSNADVLLTIDSDILFRAADAISLAEQAHQLQAIVAGVYATRSMARSFPTTLLETETVTFHGTDATPVPVKWAASGFMAIPRAVFQALAKRPDMPLLHPEQAWHFHPFYLPFVTYDDNGKPILLSEDFALCERARAEGFGVFVNPAIALGHVGSKVYRLQDALAHEVPGNPMKITRFDVAKYRYELLDDVGQKQAPEVAVALL